MKKNWKAWLGLVLVFFAGIVAGVVGTRVVTRRVIQAVIQHPDLVRERIEHDLVRRLKLTPDQQAKVHITLTETQRELGDLRTEFQPRFVVIMTNAQSRISDVLTPEQQKKFEKIKEDNRRIFPH